MQFPTLIRGKILKRYKRFFTDLELDGGEVITAHTPNTGSMRTCLAPGMVGLVSERRGPTRKLPYTLEMTFNGESYIGVNTSLTNQIAYEALTEGNIGELKQYQKIQREFKIGNSRIDFYLEQEGAPPCLTEVKNVSLREEDGIAYFPDSVSVRGQKHLHELLAFAEKGNDAAMLFIITREDVKAFSPASHIDPVYSDLLKRVFDRGIAILPYSCKLGPEGIVVEKKLPLLFNRLTAR
ncbi:MAG: hypothetical protein A2X86_01305 [Bdellovibrionales bacterium GWA2_49_15]|nr:MAG: hypothetical protein A2X86_01305 [Bdellovibrionales bacterium GWA2_49_15]